MNTPSLRLFASKGRRTEAAPAGVDAPGRAPTRRLDIELPRLGPWSSLATATLLVLAASLVRLGLLLLAPQIVPFVAFYPAVLAAALLAGWRGGLVATGLSMGVSWILFLPPDWDSAPLTTPEAANLAAFGLTSLALVLAGAGARRLIDAAQESRGALAERNLRFDAVFEAMSEGFALCEAEFGPDGQLADYVIQEMNPALQSMLRVGPEAIGMRYSAGGGDTRQWLAICHRVMRTGAPESFEFQVPGGGRWYEIRLSRVDGTRMAQFFFDVTARKAAEARQADLFDELNHRVKNNLLIVSGLLQMQARSASEQVASELLKAVDRVGSIARVHEALYRGERSEEIEFAGYLKELCESLSQAMLVGDRVRIELDVRPASLALDTAISLGVIVNELVTNALKHAYPEPARGVVLVSCRRTEDGLLLTVSDAGAGLPDDAGERPRSLGMKLVTSLAVQIGADLAQRGPPGATFEIHVPTERLRPEAGAGAEGAVR